jgi:glucosamine--fructose-6-phosphate aminotransferase (isomerizing)
MRKYDVNQIGKIMQSEIAEIPAVFTKLIAAESQFGALSNLLKTSQIQSVLVLARGTSDNAAHFLKYLIETQLGLPVGLTSPSSVTIYHAKLNFKNTLVVAISQSGQSTDLVEYATAAKGAGATLISITNDETSPLAELADHHLALMAGAEFAVAATKSYAAQLLASLMLVSAWSSKLTNYKSVIAAATELLANNSALTTAVSKCDRANEIVVLGRGFSYPNAREAALKIQETSKISVQGLSIADYMHGPISALTNKTQVLIFAPNGIPLESLKSDLEKIRAKSPNIFWFGTGDLALPNETVIPGAKCENEIYSSVVDSIILQTFALEFARKNDLDPDSPEGLSKVTFTR